MYKPKYKKIISATCRFTKKCCFTTVALPIEQPHGVNGDWWRVAIVFYLKGSLTKKEIGFKWCTLLSVALVTILEDDFFFARQISGGERKLSPSWVLVKSPGV